jgi:hypothetical protein
MALISSPVSGLNLEGSALALWNEFLAAYFDGLEHTLGLIPGVQFPQAVLRFQEAALPQPMEGDLGISVVWVAPSSICTHWDTLTAAEIAASGVANPPLRQQRATAHGSFLFLIRANEAGANANAQKQVADGAALLYALLENSLATEPLSQKGIHKLRPRPPRLAFPGDGSPGTDLNYRLRVLACGAVLRYPVISQNS